MEAREWTPPNPKLLIAPLLGDQNKEHMDRMNNEDDKRSAADECLREVPEYEDFIFHFAECALYTTEFNEIKGSSLLSDYMPASLEAFMVLAYVNAFDSWMYEYNQKHDRAANEGVKTPRRKFTDEARGAEKYCGWSRAGILLHAQIAEKLTEQRQSKRTVRLELFEESLKDKFCKVSGTVNRNQADERPFAETDLMFLRATQDVQSGPTI
jgi:hypothetical protein